jgi:hypothetical protein
MRILVCGGRNFLDYEAIMFFLSRFNPKESVLIHGHAQGADQLAMHYATLTGWSDIRGYPANWRVHGKAAGPIRNKRMLDDGKPDLVIAFAGGKGTDSMTKLARKAGVLVWEVTSWSRRHGS